MHSVWRPLKMYVDFSSERFSLCILFTFIKRCPAQYFIFIVASRPSWQPGLYEKQNKTKQSTESKGLLLREYENREGRRGCQNGQCSWAQVLCSVISLSVVSQAPSPTSTLAKQMWEPNSGSALSLQLCSLKNLGGFCEINTWNNRKGLEKIDIVWESPEKGV